MTTRPAITHRVPCITQWAFWPWPLPWLQRCKGQEVQATRATALSSRFLYTLSESKQAHGQWHSPPSRTAPPKGSTTWASSPAARSSPGCSPTPANARAIPPSAPAEASSVGQAIRQNRQRESHKWRLSPTVGQVASRRRDHQSSAVASLAAAAAALLLWQRQGPLLRNGASSCTSRQGRAQGASPCLLEHPQTPPGCDGVSCPGVQTAAGIKQTSRRDTCTGGANAAETGASLDGATPDDAGSKGPEPLASRISMRGPVSDSTMSFPGHVCSGFVRSGVGADEARA